MRLLPLEEGTRLLDERGGEGVLEALVVEAADLVLAQRGAGALMGGEDPQAGVGVEHVDFRRLLHPAGDVRAFAGLKIAAVGGKTADALREWGLEPDLVPSGEQSARGLLTRLGRAGAPGSVLCVHGRPHRPELADGLRELGAEVTEAVAYAMADWPAPEPLGGQAPGAAGEERPAESAAPALDRQATAEVLHERAADVVLVTSPRQLEALHFLGPLPEPVVCLGSTTVARARELGLAAVTAVSPAPEDLAEAALRARSG